MREWCRTTWFSGLFAAFRRRPSWPLAARSDIRTGSLRSFGPARVIGMVKIMAVITTSMVERGPENGKEG